MKVSDKVKFDEKGLVPAITQDFKSGHVLMMAYMNLEAFEKTIETGKVHYYSRSRKKLWLKGESSGHVQAVREIFLDCDGDTVLIKVDQEKAACHTGRYSCFYRKVEGDSLIENSKKIFDEGEVYGDKRG
ncbi:MAG: phosphoribosyl-AMP cyclohydrolase [Deltaproteobacteria bacterium]|nr:phosphoribosyl-AMP cyclohydrolase [Deltaproteobacteria bacterium]